jgi:hypothetical protein
MTGITACGNALVGTLTFTKTVGNFTFGRTVVVTGAFVRRVGATTEGLNTLRLVHHTSQLAAGTDFATVTISITGDGAGPLTWLPFTVSAEKTFTSDEILGFSIATGTALSAGAYDLIIRYKDK